MHWHGSLALNTQHHEPDKSTVVVCRAAAAADGGEVTGVRREAAAHGGFLTYRAHALFPRGHASCAISTH